MRRLAATFLLALIAWFFLTYSIHPENIAMGIIVSGSVTLISRHTLSRETPEIFLHPIRWIWSIAYAIVLACSVFSAHLDVISRVITGRIRPAIVSVDPEFKTPLGKTIFGNSVTLTPGTLTIKVSGNDGRFMIHALAHDQKREIGEVFKKYGKRVMSG